jgi:hypothetical protein
MQGYRKKRREFVLKFENEEFEGLEVRASSTSLGNLVDLMDLAEMDRASVREEKERLMQLFEKFMACVKSWNLEHEIANDEWIATPLTVDGLLLHESDFVLDLVFAWMDGITGTSGPLGRKSDGGKPSEELELPMEPL